MGWREELEKRVCVNCGREYTPVAGHQKFCGAKCSNQYQERTAMKRKHPELVIKPHLDNCEYCGREFMVDIVGRIYCSPECTAAARAEGRRLNGRVMITESVKDRKVEKRRAKVAEACRATPSKKRRVSTFEETSRRAAECGLSYGYYQAALRMGKTYEELKKEKEERRKNDESGIE